MEVSEIPKYVIAPEEVESIDLANYIEAKYEDHEQYGGFMIRPPQDLPKYTPKYTPFTMSLAMPEVTWKSQRRSKIAPYVYQYESTSLKNTSPMDLIKFWHTESKRPSYFKGKSTFELVDEFTQLLRSPTKFRGARYGDGIEGNLFPGEWFLNRLHQRNNPYIKEITLCSKNFRRCQIIQHQQLKQGCQRKYGLFCWLYYLVSHCYDCWKLV